MPQIYFRILLAVAKYQSGNGREAQAHLREALDTALLDKMYLPFADYEYMPRMLNMLEEDCFPDDNVRAELLLLCERKTKGIHMIKAAMTEIEMNKGTQSDPKVAPVFADIIARERQMGD